MSYFTERNGMRKPIEKTYDIDHAKYDNWDAVSPI